MTTQWFEAFAQHSRGFAFVLLRQHVFSLSVYGSSSDPSSFSVEPGSSAYQIEKRLVGFYGNQVLQWC